MRNEIKFKRKLTGEVFHRLTVLGYSRWEKKHYWNCKCECGNEAEVEELRLVRGETKSCGCLQREAARANKSPTTHGMCQSLEYQSFQKMIARCNNPKNNRFYRYGGRGIKVIWASFEEFYRDMGPKPSPRHSIDRINNDGNYCKDNCRWATPSEQSNNRSTTRKIYYNGVELSMDEWSRSLGIPSSTIFNRLENGFPLESVFHKGRLPRSTNLANCND